VDRLGRNGKPCRWEGRILAEVVDQIEQADDVFSATDWNNRSVVEIRAAKKSLGWFFHAITGEEWLLKMKFRTAKNTFRRDELLSALDLKPLNDVPELPLYGSEPRTQVRQLRGPWQEVELRVHWHHEIDRDEFRQFLQQAIAGFRKFTDKAKDNPADLMPWKALGRRWHFLRKGFPKGSRVAWHNEVLEKLLDLLTKTAPQGELVWGNKQVVPLCVPNQHEPWAAVQTKKLDAVYLTLTGPKGHFALGRLTQLGHEPELDGEQPDKDLIRLKFRSADDLKRGDLAAFLREHLKTLNGKP
jgi:excinuclease ABC subunit A